MDQFHEVLVGVSESVVKKSAKRLLADKSRWRHIRLVIKPRKSRTPCIVSKKLLMNTLMESGSLSNLKKQQILKQKTYQLINVVNDVSRSHKTAIIFFHLTYSSIAC